MTTKSLVKHFMTRNPVTVSESTSVLEARTLMRDRKIRRLLVVDDQLVVGILTLGDLRGVHAEEAIGPGMRASVLMHENPITVTPETTLRQAAMIMVEKKVSGLPVVTDGVLVGIITESDLFRALIEHETDALDPQPIGVVEGDAF
ncbi:MAG: CBS domain-containing protein [Thermoflexales bacterium]